MVGDGVEFVRRHLLQQEQRGVAAAGCERAALEVGHEAGQIAASAVGIPRHGREDDGRGGIVDTERSNSPLP